MSSIPDKTYQKGEAAILFPFSNYNLGIIKDKKGNKYKLNVISKHRRTGFIYYKLEKEEDFDDDDFIDQLRRELEKFLKEGPFKRPEDIIKWLPPLPGRPPVGI